MRARDNRRQRLYDAERTATFTESPTAVRLLHGGTRVTSTGNLSIEACQQYVDHVTTAAWFQRRWGRHSMKVVHKVYGSATYTWGVGRIALPPWARGEWTILHEIAHGLISNDDAPHGPEFAAAFLLLVRQMMGRESYESLRAEFRARKVRVAALPKPTPGRVVVPRGDLQRAAVAAKRRQQERETARQREAREEQARRAVGYGRRQQSAATLRALIKDGFFGPAGSKPRTHALATARAIEKTVVPAQT